ncbi:MAG: aminodeoxychorismate synthase component I, partial [Desulfitobacterium sp.]|nr:aminodeoxychorismate synthase component I [Desulfitobacterium sp.]
VIRAKSPVHGKVSSIRHDGKGVFANLPNPLTVTRYHSLALRKDTLPEELIITSETEDGEIMGIRHRELPIEGVQFHPEAILTEKGHELLANAVKMARLWWQKQKETTQEAGLAKEYEFNSPWLIKKLDLELQPIELLDAFRDTVYPFFLDSGKSYADLGKYSFMGAFPFIQASAYKDRVEITHFDFEIIIKNETIPCGKGEGLEVMDELVARYQVENPTSFPFVGGGVGFWTYDLKDELEDMPQEAEDTLGLPLWRFAWYDGVLVYDHEQESYTLLACGMSRYGECRKELAQARVEKIEGLIEKYLAERKLKGSGSIEGSPSASKAHQLESLTQADSEVEVQYTVTREQYLKDLRKLIDYIYAGDIYQANLTQRFQIPTTKDPFELYQTLHRVNPAPFAAFLPYEDFQILSSSPERFVQITAQGEIETRPIKGTRPRGKTPEEDEAYAKELQESVKDRAELTMIIDLQRNDLGRICRYGSVQVTDLIRLEKYPTVWHLVSTINGVLRPGLRVSEILQAIFPGGSITGAPKIRAMEIIEELEPYKRGLYTGSIGYISFDGAWDTNIVIRTILLKDGMAYFNGGGGIVADSIPEEEHEESLQKVRALIRVLSM